MTSLTSVQVDRAVGSVLASAAGDALGSQYEFGPSLGDDMVPEFGIGYFGHGVGEWTDDTSMAMPILLQLAQGHRLEDPDALAAIVEDWLHWSHTSRDVGAQTRALLGRLVAGAITEESARAASESLHARHGRSGGNGSLMPPVPSRSATSTALLPNWRQPPAGSRSSRIGKTTTRMPARCGASRSDRRSSRARSTCARNSSGSLRSDVNAGCV